VKSKPAVKWTAVRSQQLTLYNESNMIGSHATDDWKQLGQSGDMPHHMPNTSTHQQYFVRPYTISHDIQFLHRTEWIWWVSILTICRVDSMEFRILLRIYSALEQNRLQWITEATISPNISSYQQHAVTICSNLLNVSSIETQHSMKLAARTIS